MNTLTLEFLAELGRALDLALARPARALVLTGEGRAFCCGAHLPYFTDPASPVPNDPQGIRDIYVGPIARLFDRLEALPFPTIAAINGLALGGGCELALACDLRVMSDDARIAVPEVHVGALPGAGGVQKLQHIVGRGRALDMVLSGRQIGAAEALAWGLATATAPAAALRERTLELVAALRRGGPLALAHAKASIYRTANAEGGTAREMGLDAVQILSGAAEWREGMAAFVEKRPPRF
jgi:enoyl-CoA hydratase/carnithine racemase